MGLACCCGNHSMLKNILFKKQNPTSEDEEIILHQEVLGFRKVLASIEWLLAILVILYLKIPGAFVRNEAAITYGLVFFVGCILLFHYIWPSSFKMRWVLLIEIWIMIAFITFVLWHTGKIQSPMISLYFLVIITAAVALDPRLMLFNVALISACCFFLACTPETIADFSLASNIGFVMLFFSFWLVAYLATMLSRQTDIARKKIQHLSETDYLTGLYNMRSFVLLVKNEYKRSIRRGHPFSIMMLDADNLKPVNDTYGHESGSNMIQLIAKVIQNNLRASDVAARFGGDEFVVLLIETDAGHAAIAGERIRKAVASSPLAVAGGSVTVTISIGIACFPDHGITVEEIINRADNAMYRSKKNGKNRTTVYSEEHAQMLESRPPGIGP
jgi:diguanylate cyclase (GGDEF)-like protein